MKGGGFIRDFLVEKENIYSILFIYTPLFNHGMPLVQECIQRYISFGNGMSYFAPRCL